MSSADQFEQKLERWIEASVIDGETAVRIRAFESSHESHGTRWPVVLAIVFGSIMVGAGILLFVAAHWDDLSPAQRFLLVLAMIAGFHLAAGALMPRLKAMGIALHAIGTVALGAGIFLAGQIFNLQEHWPGGVLLWAVGAVLGWALLRDWVQAALAAVLVPAWIAAEWSVRTEHISGSEKTLVQFLTLLAITYFSAHRGATDSHFRRALAWVGGIALLPLCGLLSADHYGWQGGLSMSVSLRVVGVLMAFGLPLLAAWLLRGRAFVWNLAFALWVFVMGLLSDRDTFQRLAVYGVCALGAIGLVVWGVEEQRRERINLGIAGFAITIIAFYFSTVMDKLGRSASLVGFGLLFLLGGWKLEQLRRRLVAGTRGGA